LAPKGKDVINSLGGVQIEEKAGLQIKNQAFGNSGGALPTGVQACGPGGRLYTKRPKITFFHE